MRHGLLWLVQGGLILYAFFGLFTLWSHFTKKLRLERTVILLVAIYMLLWMIQSGLILYVFFALFTSWSYKYKPERIGLLILTILGPATLALCWQTQLLFMEEEAVFWSRLMAGKEGPLFRIGTVGLILGSGFALGALSLREGFRALVAGAIFVACSWYIIYLHPTPHYVPMPSWADKLIWFGLIVGGAGFCLFVYAKLRPYLQWSKTLLVILATVSSSVAVASVVAFHQAQQPIELQSLEPQSRLQVMGCFACHTIGGKGYAEPGGALESVASRQEDVVRAFMASPDAETAKKLGIRENPTGGMQGVRLREEEIEQIVSSMKQLFAIQPPSLLGPGTERIEEILMNPTKTCLACHTVKGQGAPDGGIGGPLEAAADMEREKLIEWLKEPSYVKALELNIRETPTGAMISFPLEQEQAELIADWIMTLD